MARKKAEGQIEPAKGHPRRMPKQAPTDTKKTPRKQTTPTFDESILDASFASSCDHVAGKGGWKDSSIVGSEARKLLVGLPLPSLAAEMLLMCTCWPVGRIFQLIGEEGCGKSTLICEVIRWLMLYGGFAHIFENEGKDNAPIREAILEYNQHWLERRVRLDWTKSMDDWIRRVRRNMEETIVNNAGKPDDGVQKQKTRFGWRVPYGYFVDSVRGTGTVKRQDDTDKEGAPSQDFAREAGMLSDELMSWPGRIRNTSLIFGCTNHMKPDRDRFGHKMPRAPVGKALKFYESLEIHMDRAKSDDLERLDRGGYTVSLFTAKNSFAPQKRQIWVNVVWEKEETDDPKHPRKRIYWDWHAATLDALLRFMSESARHRKAIAEVVDINPVRGHQIWSEALGIPEDDPVDYHTAGRLIDYDPDIRQRLRAVIGIEPMNHFRPYVPLREIYETASPVTDDALRSVYLPADRDLSSFADVTHQLAGQVVKDSERVDRQRRDEEENMTEDVDEFSRGLDPD
jgi:RecA/RadA recombinase